MECAVPGQCLVFYVCEHAAHSFDDNFVFAFRSWCFFVLPFFSWLWSFVFGLKFATLNRFDKLFYTHIIRATALFAHKLNVQPQPHILLCACTHILIFIRGITYFWQYIFDTGKTGRQSEWQRSGFFWYVEKIIRQCQIPSTPSMIFRTSFGSYYENLSKISIESEPRLKRIHISSHCV